ncbi:hypothetical protein F5Y04DRAFT_275043 [Hypomontagnella monticulosa]|nr:hypothetical protein F5Y04DRAFT_275043 [Hypomontagnella monticulosa]
MSTVGGMQSSNALLDAPSLDTQFECAEPAGLKVLPLDIRQNTLREAIVSTSSSMKGDALVTDLARSSSPSDAMLMSRGVSNIDRTSRQCLVSVQNTRPNLAHLVVPLDFAGAHRRAISAPDFTAADAIDKDFRALPGKLPSASSPLRGEPRSSYFMEATSPSPAAPGPPPPNNGIVCMYKPDCDTGSQLRKAISHIFGRNKTCTRNIPPHVWVHFCRKHYQRSRYRNAHEWAKVQCDLVQTQIRRVEEWSDENKRNGQPGIVQEWSLSMRKREQNRVQEKSIRKRSYRDESDDDDDTLPDHATLNGTAVPDWLRSKCGDGYSTAEIEEIVARLKQEMEETNMTQIPDIEILPNISMDTASDARPKTMLKRKTSTGSQAHKRSQSVGVALRPESQPMARRVSQPTYWRNEDALRPTPLEKRQRMSDPSLYSEPYNDRWGHTNSRFPERPSLAPLRPTYTLPHRPAFGNIQESHAEESYYNRDDNQAPNYSYDHWPTSAQRNGSHPAATTPDSNAPRDYAYPLNKSTSNPQRSLPEVENAHHNFTFRSPLEYPSTSSNYSPDSAPYERVPNHPENPPTSAAPSGYYNEYGESPHRGLNPYQPAWSTPYGTMYPSGYRHTRHQSTPSASHISVPQASIMEYGHANGARSLAPYEQASSYHRRQRSYAPPPPYPRTPLAQESEETQTVYSERR